MAPDRPLTARERCAVIDRCRVCGDLKLCDPADLAHRDPEKFFERYGVRPEDLKPNANGTPRFKPGVVCIDCRREAAKMYARERGLSLRRNKSIHWLSPDSTRNPQFQNKPINAGMPLFHQLPKEQRGAAQRMLDQRVATYREKHGRLPNIHAKYLLVANVIRSIKSPNGSLHKNFMREKLRLRKQFLRVLFARHNQQVHAPVSERVYTPGLEGI